LVFLTGSFFLGSDSFEGERAGADEAGTGNIVSSENAGFMGSWFLYEIEKKMVSYYIAEYSLETKTVLFCEEKLPQQ